MNEIIAILEVLRPLVSTSSFRHLTLLIEAALAMTGRVTMLGLSRWAEPGGSYRTVQRFFKRNHDWMLLRWRLIEGQVKAHGGTYILVGDEVVVTKSGQQTFGLGNFFLRCTSTSCPACVSYRWRWCTWSRRPLIRC